MSRVLVTGGVGTFGVAVVRRLLADPAYDVRVADREQAPQWMREACEVRTGDLTDPGAATAAMTGCAYAIHLAGPSTDAGRESGARSTARLGAETRAGAGPGDAETKCRDLSLIAAGVALDSALLAAAAEQGLERFVYVSCASPPPKSAHAFALLAGERLCEAAQAEHGLAYTICRPGGHRSESVEQIAAEIVAALSSPLAAAGERRAQTPKPRRTR